jgi:ketosteroid isomerase-like protein
MSQENVEVVRAAIGAMSFDAAEEDKREARVARLATDVEFEEDPRFPEAGTYRGREEVLRYLTQFVAQFDTFLFTVEDLLDAGQDDVLVCLRIEGHGKGSGAEFDVRAGWVFTVDDGQVIRIRAYYERAAAFEAAGLSEL